MNYRVTQLAKSHGDFMVIHLFINMLNKYLPGAHFWLSLVLGIKERSEGKSRKMLLTSKNVHAGPGFCRLFSDIPFRVPYNPVHCHHFYDSWKLGVLKLKVTELLRLENRWGQEYLFKEPSNLFSIRKTTVAKNLVLLMV